MDRLQSGGADIAAQSPEGASYSVEVKYLGQSDEDFSLVFGSMTGGPRAGFLGLYGAINYLLFRVYEAAFSLRDESNPRTMAIMVADPNTWMLLEMPLANAWLDWAHPAFLQTDEQPWNRFLESQRQGRYPAIDRDLPHLVRTLDRIWIATLGNGFRYSMEHELGSR